MVFSFGLQRKQGLTKRRIILGDTMNTAARIESTGEPGKIHVSQETANLLTQAGKGSWLIKRDETVIAKGKGEIATYFVSPRAVRHQGSSMKPEMGSETSESSVGELDNQNSDERTERLIHWNVTSLMNLIKQVVARRNAVNVTDGERTANQVATPLDLNFSTYPLDEVKEIISLPEFNRNAAKRQVDLKQVTIDPRVEKQLTSYVTCIAYMYLPNSFHNFEHAR